MEFRAFASRLLMAESLQGKLIAPPSDMTDQDRGAPQRLTAPIRPHNLSIDHHRKVKVPKISGMGDPDQRGRIIHALANHELQAVELFAWALLAFPESPPDFRRGLLAIIADEQRHFCLYEQRLNALGLEFGDQLLTGHFWTKIGQVKSPLEFVCTMGLTFENANLDFAQEYAEAAKKVGDHETAQVLAAVHQDEIRHVKFGWRWLDYFKCDSEDHWTAYNKNIAWPLGPTRARGASFDVDARRMAGFSEDFILKLEAAEAESPGGNQR